MNQPLIPRDRCEEHLRVTTALSSFLTRLVLYRALNMLDLRQLNELVAYSHEVEQDILAGEHGTYWRVALERAREK